MLKYYRLVVVWMTAATGFTAAQTCFDTDPDTFFNAARVDVIAKPDIGDPAACCIECNNEPTCEVYTFAPSSFTGTSNMCYLIPSSKYWLVTSTSLYNAGLRSGTADKSTTPPLNDDDDFATTAPPPDDDDFTTTAPPPDDDDFTTTAPPPDDDDFATTAPPSDDDDFTTTAPPLDDDDLDSTTAPPLDDDNLATTAPPLDDDDMDSTTVPPSEIPCVEAGGNCGNDEKGERTCENGTYCQHWNPWYYQCIAVPANCPNQELDTDFYGDDIKTIKDLTPEQCCDKCREHHHCKAYTFVNYNPDGHSACYLKHGTGTKKALKGAVSALVKSSDSSCSTKVGEMCGDASGTKCCPSGSYCQPWNQWYYQCIPTPMKCSKQKTDVDFYGHDLSTKFGLSPDQCCDECAAMTGCVAYTFVNDNPGQTACYLKSSIAGETHKVGCVSGVVHSHK